MGKEENLEVYQKSTIKKVLNFDTTIKKHKNRRNHKDCSHNFATVQEMLMHGPKLIPNTSNKVMGLLSVTTV